MGKDLFKHKNIRRVLSSKPGYAVTASCIGVILFLLIYGYAPLVPDNVSFLYHSKDYDLMSHQFGFDFYRYSSWMHPWGDTFSYPYPYLSSVINSDSIPLLAIPAKVLSSVLPAHFQYFGIWHMLCFALQGCAAALVLRRLGGGFRQTMVAVPLFVCNVPLLFRCFHHSSLAGQWLILFAFLLILEQEELTVWKNCLFWCLLCAASILVHGYIFIMIGVLLTLNSVYLIFFKKRIRDTLIIFGLCVLTFFIFYYEGGGTAVHSDVEIYGLGVYSLDLADVFNPEYSSFFSPFYLSNSEGALYMGAGIFILMLVALGLLWIKRAEIETILRRKKGVSVFIFASAVLLIFISFGTCGKFAGIELYNLRPVMGDGIASKLSMLRSSSRFIWPLWYIVLIGIVVCLFRMLRNNRLTIIILLSCLIIQYMDVVPVTAKGGADTVIHGYSSPISENFSNVFSEDAKHLTLLGPSLIVDAADFAARNHMTINASKVGRGPKNHLQIDTDSFNEKKYSDDSVYVINVDHAEFLSPVILPDDLSIYLCDRYIIIFDKDLMSATPGSGAVRITADELRDIILEKLKTNGFPEYINDYQYI